MADWPIGGGEMGERVRALDWGATPLGSAERWPQSLRTVVELVLANRTPMLVLWGGELIRIYNDAYRAILGAAHPQALGRAATREPAYEQVLAGKEPPPLDEPREARGADGSDAWFELGYSPLRDEAGEIAGVLVTARDVTGRRVAEDEEASGRLFQHQTVLLAELQHRVRNILALVRSIVRRTGEGATDVEDFYQHLEGRIDALARTQVLLTRRAGAGVDLGNLVHEELLAQVADADSVVLDGPPVQLAPKAAEVLTLAVHELATNSLKYGALAQGGRLAVSWSVEPAPFGPGRLTLRWVETGVRLLAPAPRRRGFGAELIEARVAYELKGEGRMRFVPGGVQAEIVLPLIEGESILTTDSP